MKGLSIAASVVVASLLTSVAFAGEEPKKETNEVKSEFITVRDIPAGTTCIDRDEMSGNCKRLIDPETTSIYRKANERWLYEEHDTELARKLSQP